MDAKAFALILESLPLAEATPMIGLTFHDLDDGRTVMRAGTRCDYFVYEAPASPGLPRTLSACWTFSHCWFVGKTHFISCFGDLCCVGNTNQPGFLVVPNAHGIHWLNGDRPFYIRHGLFGLLRASRHEIHLYAHVTEHVYERTQILCIPDVEAVEPVDARCFWVKRRQQRRSCWSNWVAFASVHEDDLLSGGEWVVRHPDDAFRDRLGPWVQQGSVRAVVNRRLRTLHYPELALCQLEDAQERESDCVGFAVQADFGGFAVPAQRRSAARLLKYARPTLRAQCAVAIVHMMRHGHAQRLDHFTQVLPADLAAEIRWLSERLLFPRWEA